MAYFRIPQDEGMGTWANVVAAVAGPLVQGGADIYATSEGSKLTRKELKQREAESQRMQQLAVEQLAAQERQAYLAQQAAIQRSQITGHYFSRSVPYVLGAVGLLALAAVAVSTLRRN